MAPGPIYINATSSDCQSGWWRKTSPELGDGQTWLNVAASRAWGVTYSNNTGRTIFVSASCRAITTNGGTCWGVVDGAIVQQGSGPSYGTSNIAFPVQAGSTYSISTQAGGYLHPTVEQWAELR